MDGRVRPGHDGEGGVKPIVGQDGGEEPPRKSAHPYPTLSHPPYPSRARSHRASVAAHDVGERRRAKGRRSGLAQARDLIGKPRGAECLRSWSSLYPVRVRRSTDLVTAFPGLDSQEARNDHALGAWSQPEPPVHAIAGAARPTHPRPTPQWPQPSQSMPRADQAAGTWRCASPAGTGKPYP